MMEQLEIYQLMKKAQLVIKNIKGYSLVEIMLATSIFVMIATTLIITILYGQESSALSGARARATYLAEEALEASRNMRDDSYLNLADGTYGLTISGGQWVFSGTEDVTDIYTRQVTVSSVDANTKRIVASITWQQNPRRVGNVTLTTYLTSWTTSIWEDTTLADFNAGINQDTVTASDGDGVVKLGTIVYADWCNPSLTLTNYDLPGNGIAATVTAIPGEVFFGTGGNSSGLSFADVTVTSADPPVATTVGTFDGYKTNDSFGEGDFGYLATDTNDKEIVILNISSTPFTEIGSFNSPGSGNGDSIFVSGTRGYMTDGNTFRIFDLTAKTGSRAQLGNGLTLTANGKNIVVVGNYAYVAVDSSTTQMQIIDVTNPATMSVVGQVQTNALGAVDLYVNADGNRAYLATKNSATQNELHIINTSTKTGNRPVISSYNSNGMDPHGITVITGQRAILVGHGGTQQYQVVNISNENSPVQCGGLAMSLGVNGVASVTDFNSNAYSYVVTPDTSSELKIIRGGPGGGFGGGLGYPVSGNFTSRVFDTSAMSDFLAISWTNQVPSNTDLRMQIRAGNTANLNSVAWVGPDGTGSTFFTNEAGEFLPALIQNNRYIQYKAYFTSDTISTPVLEAFRANYEN